ncbi:hypothetical protein QOT17_019367 [Balamuthia mandrillaris]
MGCCPSTMAEALGERQALLGNTFNNAVERQVHQAERKVEAAGKRQMNEQKEKAVKAVKEEVLPSSSSSAEKKKKEENDKKDKGGPSSSSTSSAKTKKATTEEQVQLFEKLLQEKPNSFSSVSELANFYDKVLAPVPPNYRLSRALLLKDWAESLHPFVSSSSSSSSEESIQFLLHTVQLYNIALCQLGSTSSNDKKVEETAEQITKQLLETESEALSSLLSFSEDTPFKADSFQEHRKELAALRQSIAASLSSSSPRELSKRYSNGAKQLLNKLLEAFRWQEKLPSSLRLALLSGGSMGRKQMCPYSDVEYVLLVDDEAGEGLSAELKEKLRRLALVFQLLVTNLGETPNKFVEGLPHSVVEQKQGLSVDENFNPIRDPDQAILSPPLFLSMLQPRLLLGEVHLDPLVTSLRFSTFLAGDKQLWKDTTERIQKEVYGKDKETCHQLGEATMKEFCTGRYEVDFERVLFFNVKEHLYRKFMGVITGLALYHGIVKGNAWKQIEVLREKGKITKEGANNLLRCLDLIMSLRIRTHLHYKTEQETVYHKTGEEKGEEEKEDPEEIGKFWLSEEDAKALQEIYLVLIMLDLTAAKFLDKEKPQRDAFKKSELKIESNETQGMVAFRMGQWKEATDCFGAMLSVERDQHSSETLRLATRYLAFALFNSAKTAEAQRRFSEALSLDRDEQDLLNASLDLEFLARCSLRTARESKDEKVAQTALEHLKEAESIAKDIISSSSSSSEVTEEEKRLQRAVKQRLASVYRAQGEAFLLRREFKSAEESFLNSIATDEQVHGPQRQHQSFLDALDGLVAVYEAAGEKEKAQEAQAQKLLLARRMHGAQHVGGADALFKVLAAASPYLSIAAGVVGTIALEVVNAELENEKRELQRKAKEEMNKAAESLKFW